MRSMTKLAATIAVAAFLLVSCLDDQTDEAQSAAEKAQESRSRSVSNIANSQGFHEMKYSSTVDTINFWVDTWGQQPNKLAYVYLVNADGKPLGYYIIKGLPVSYCASLTPSYDWADVPGDEDDIKTQVPAPGVDGAYYSGGQCSTFYARDATTNAYIEYTAGLGINVLLYDQPLPAFNGATALGPTSVDDVK